MDIDKLKEWMLSIENRITELEKKGIIARERWGRMNRVKIIAESYDKVYFDKVEKNNTKNENKE